MPRHRDGLTAEFLRRHGGADPETVIRRLCDRLLAEAGVTVPVDMRVLASFRGVADIAVVDQDEAGCIYFDGDHLVIHTRRADSEERRRFTIGHEINHTFFPGFRDERRSRSDASVGRYDRSRTEEYLCDIGGAELLLPHSEVRRRLTSSIDLAAIIELARTFQATIEATALRAAALCGRPAAIAVLEPGWRKADEAEMRLRSRIPGPTSRDRPPIPKKLRVRWSASYGGFPVIPRNKSVGDATPLAGILDCQQLDYRGETGLVPGPVTVSARYLPYRRGDTRADRVLLLLQSH